MASLPTSSNNIAMRIFLFLLVASIFGACNSTPPQTTAVKKKEQTNTPKIAATTYPADMPPVYEQFDDLAYIFNQQSDTTYIINFWATWCKPCVAELPYFETLTEKHKEAPVKVILVSLDFKKQLVKKLLPFIKKHELQSEVLVLTDPDANTWVDKVDPKWSGAIPVTLIYKQKKRAFYEEAVEDLAALEKVVQPFL